MEWVAHRGESELAPENTLAAFGLAWERGADAVELDVHLTRDERLVVCHDSDTRRTCGVGMTIKEHTLAQLRTLDAGIWKGEPFRGQMLPMLEKVLPTVPERKRLLIEIKCGIEAATGLRRAVAASGKPSEQVVFLSFQPDVCAAMKRTLAEHHCYLLAGFKLDQKTGAWAPTIEHLITLANENGLDGLGLQDKPAIDTRAVATIHAAGLGVSIWTVDEPQRAFELIAMGVDGIITNRCSWLRKQVG